jgi:hypothetical protein
MANSTITNLPVASTISGSEYLEVVQAGTSSRATATQLATYLASSLTAASIANNSSVPGSTVQAALNVLSGSTTSALSLGSGWGTSPSIVYQRQYGNMFAFFINVGTGASVSTGNIVLPLGNPAVDGWLLMLFDSSNPNAYYILETAQTLNAGVNWVITVTNYNRANRAATNWLSNENIVGVAIGY